MSAMIQPPNPLEGTGITMNSQDQYVADRDTWVPAEYMARLHTGSDLEAVVTMDSEPITEAGITLHVKDVPVERRYALQSVVDGKCEVYANHIFAGMEELVYAIPFRKAGSAPDDDSKRYIPNVRTFVCTKVDASNPARIVPLCTPNDPHQEAIVPEMRYDATNDKFVAWEAEKGEETDELKARLAELEAKITGNSGETVDPKPEKVLEAAPCGKEVTKGYVAQHSSRCPEPECNPEPEAA